MSNNNINYSQCWEDSHLMIEALCIAETDKVLSIGSGGDNSLLIISKNPISIDIVDISQTQINLCELKYKAFQFLEISFLHEFLGVRESKKRQLSYLSFSSELSKECKLFWDANLKDISKGIVHVGKFEKYLSAFRKWILPLVNSKKHTKRLLEPKSEHEQEIFYLKRWNNWRWNFLFNLFFSEKNLKKRGRAKGMFNQSKTDSVAQYYKDKTKKALLKPSLFYNSYLEYIFDSKHTTTLPDYINPDNVLRVKKATTSVQFHATDLLSFLKLSDDNIYLKFNLSDIFEPLTIAETNMLFNEIYRVAKPEAILIFWNNLVERDIPSTMNKKFIKLKDKEDILKQNDRVFFYNCFKIYKVIK